MNHETAEKLYGAIETLRDFQPFLMAVAPEYAPIASAVLGILFEVVNVLEVHPDPEDAKRELALKIGGEWQERLKARFG